MNNEQHERNNRYNQPVVGSALLGMSVIEVPSNLLELIDPINGEKYSPNLHAYLATREDLHFIGLYNDSNDYLWLGNVDGNAFMGVRLMDALTKGSKAQSGAHLYLGQLVKHGGFWQEYIKHGRCAIDPEHITHFVGDKDRVVDNQCSWCGKVILPEELLAAKYIRIIPKDNLEAVEILSEFKSLKNPSREQAESCIERLFEVLSHIEKLKIFDFHDENPIVRERKRLEQENTQHPN